MIHSFWRFTLLNSATLPLKTLSLERFRWLLKKKQLYTTLKIRLAKSSVCFSHTINDALTYFAKIFIHAFLAGMFDNRIAGELASKTANDWDTTVLKGIDGFFSPPRDSCPKYSYIGNLWN